MSQKIKITLFSDGKKVTESAKQFLSDLSIEQNVVTEDIAPEGVKPSTTTEVGDFIARNI